MTEQAPDFGTVLREEAGQAGDGPARSATEAAEENASESEPQEALAAEALAALREEWGAEFAANFALAQEAAGAIADDALVALLEETGLGNDPRIIRTAATIGRLLRAGGETEGAAPADMDRDALEAALDELSRRPDYWSDRVQRQVREIHLSLHGDQRIPVHRAIGDGGNG